MRIPLLAQVVIAGGVGFAAVTTVTAPEQVQAVMPVQVSADCDIKGNVSMHSGERIYHVPGQEYYTDTVVEPEFGERWFCSEAEARAAGWRKSKV